MGSARRAPPPGAAHPRPLRPPHRRGGVRARLPRADAHRRRARAARRPVGRRARRRPRGPGGEVPGVERRRRARLPHLDDLRRGARPAPRARAGCALRAATHLHHLRARAARAHAEGRAHRRHVDDREAGRLRRPRQHHPRSAAVRRQLPPHRSQVVHLRPHERRVPRARAGTRRPLVLPGTAGAARRQPQPHAADAPQGQAGQPLQRLLGDRVRRRRGLARGRGGSRGAHHRRDGQHDPPGLHPRHRVGDARGHRRRRPPRAPPVGLRQAAARPAADAQRARRPGRRVRGRHHRRDAPGRRHRPRGARRRAGGLLPAARSRRQQVLGVQARARPRRRGDGVPGRQRLRGGPRHGAHLPGAAAALHLGGLRQRGRPRRAACHGS